MSDEAESGKGQTVEQEAAAMGWMPQESFRGDSAKWVDAETFVTKGREVLPILRHNNERLLGEVTNLKEELNTVRESLRASQDSIEALKEINNAETKRKVESAKQDILTKIREARESGDVESELKLTDNLSEVNIALREAGREKPQAKPQPKTISPEDQQAFRDWNQENPWYGKDQRRTALSIGIGQELMADPATANLTGRQFLDRVAEEVEKTLPNPNRQADDKVGGGRHSSSRSSNGRSYSDLPQDAKDSCERQTSRLVGPNRSFKTTADLQKYWASKYFEGGE